MRTVRYDLHQENVHNPDGRPSSAIYKIWYDSQNRELYAQYRGSQSISGYKDVSPVAVRNLLASTSVGAYFDSHIKKGGYKGIDTSDISFQPKQSVVSTPAWGSSAKLSYATNANPVVSKPKTRFRVSGVIMTPKAIEEYIEAEDFMDAMEKFKSKYQEVNPDVTGVAKA